MSRVREREIDRAQGDEAFYYNENYRYICRIFWLGKLWAIDNALLFDYYTKYDNCIQE